ncbi:MAG: GNAT family N-acetyltransferase [Chlamydiia bacterium]|nr:GNAT family N-acetyltransferase [Chlamydiia bacterium]
MKIVRESVTPELQGVIRSGFSEHAIEEMGQDGFSEPIAFVVRQERSCIGVLVVRSFWGSLHIKNLWVHRDHRKQGIGRALLSKAFVYGMKEGHAFAFVETLSFQALEFYQKLGFVLEYTRNGYAQGISFHYLRRDF